MTETKATNGWLGGEDQNAGSRQRETRWLTPRKLVEPLGTFDLDPCGAPGWELAATTYLLEDGRDGLRDPWFGRIWLNPPYGNEQEPFVERLADHGQGTALLFARTETAMFHRLVWNRARALLFLRGRVVFHRANGERASANAGAPSVLVAYGRFDVLALEGANRRAMGQLGKVIHL